MFKIKKGFVLLFTLIMLFALTACGGGSQTSSQGDTTSTDSTNSSNDTGSGDEVQEITIKISHVVAENTPKHQGSLAMKEYIEEASEGKIKVQVYPNSQLFGDKDEFQNLIANNVQFIITDMAKMVGNDPGFNIPSMPFLFNSDEAANAFWDGPKGQEILQRVEKDGALGMAMWPNGAKHVTNDKRPITKPEDVNGLKVRTQGGQVLEALYDELGAGSVSIPFSELYTALQQGTADGQENTFSNIESKKFDEVQSYLTVMGHTRVDYALMTNTTFWESLNGATRDIVSAGVAKGTEVARSSAAEINAKAFELLKERGQIEIYELSAEEIEVFREALKPVYDEFGTIIGEEIIEDAMNRK